MSTSLDALVIHREPEHRSPTLGRTPSPSFWKRSWLPLLLLAIILALGSYVRLAHLGRGDFDEDELFGYYVAESLERGEGPRLPSGQVYTRGVDVSRMVQYSVRYLGESHATVRLPSALFGVLGLFIFAGALWAMGGPWLAVWGTGLLAVYPEAVVQSRQLRFYTYQMAFGLLAFYTGWRALRTAGAREEPDRAAFGQQWLWAAGTIALLLLAARVQVVSLSILAGWGVCVVAAAVADGVARGWGAWRRSVPLQLVTVGAAVFLLALLLAPDTLAYLARRSQTAPRWAVFGSRLDPLTYYAALRYEFPVLISLLPVIFLGAIMLRPRLGAYAVIWFTVPMLLHSFVFTWKEQRFVLVAVPALFAAAAICAAWAAGALYRGVQGVAARWRLPVRLHQPLAVGVIAAGVLALIGTTPAVMETRAMVQGKRGTYTRWSDTAAILRARPDLADVPVGVGYTMHALYYWPRVDFAVRINGLERRTYRGTDGAWHVEYNPMGSPEYKVGLPVLTTPEAIQEHFADAGAVIVSFGMSAIDVDNVEKSLYERLEAEAEELCQDACGGRTKLYYWRFGARADGAADPDSAP